MRGERGGCLEVMVLVFFLLWFQAVWAGESDRLETWLKARFVPDSTQVGGMVELALAYRLPNGGQLPEKPVIQGLEGLSVEGIQKDSQEIRVPILVDRLGEFKTGPLSLGFLTPEGKTEFLRTDPVSLTVLSNLGERPEEAQIKPIAGIIPTRLGFLKPLQWGLLALGVCAAGGVLFLWLRRRRTREDGHRVQVPPHIAAEREIYELRSQQIFEKGQIKEFYFRFSEILRRYLEALRGFPAAEYTTQEIALSIQVPEDRQILPLLHDADLVKFADLSPTAAKKGDEIEQALAYIRKTGSAFESDHETHRVQGRGIKFGQRPAIQAEESGL